MRKYLMNSLCSHIEEKLKCFVFDAERSGNRKYICSWPTSMRNEWKFKVFLVYAWINNLSFQFVKSMLSWICVLQDPIPNLVPRVLSLLGERRERTLGTRLPNSKLSYAMMFYMILLIWHYNIKIIIIYFLYCAFSTVRDQVRISNSNSTRTTKYTT